MVEFIRRNIMNKKKTAIIISAVVVVIAVVAVVAYMGVKKHNEQVKEAQRQEEAEKESLAEEQRINDIKNKIVDYIEKDVYVSDEDKNTYMNRINMALNEEEINSIHEEFDNLTNELHDEAIRKAEAEKELNEAKAEAFNTLETLLSITTISDMRKNQYTEAINSAKSLDEVAQAQAKIEQYISDVQELSNLTFESGTTSVRGEVISTTIGGLISSSSDTPADTGQNTSDGDLDDVVLPDGWQDVIWR